VKIVSPFKDYYDFVAARYGGGDPGVTYVRDQLAPMKRYGGGDAHESRRELDVEGDCPLERLDDHGAQWREGWHSKYLVVAGKLYLIRVPQARRYAAGLNEYQVQPLEEPEPPRNKFRFWRLEKQFELGKEHPYLIRLSRLVGAPVFAIEHVGWSPKWNSNLKSCRIAVAGQCPILREMGMPALIDPFTMYQELAYFVGNTLRTHPDTEPPVEVTNREKILKAGFDLKASFRHR
jgi:hypothetical protein